jgi:hypothetical protein
LHQAKARAMHFFFWKCKNIPETPGWRYGGSDSWYDLRQKERRGRGTGHLARMSKYVSSYAKENNRVEKPTKRKRLRQNNSSDEDDSEGEDVQDDDGGDDEEAEEDEEEEDDGDEEGDEDEDDEDSEDEEEGERCESDEEERSVQRSRGGGRDGPGDGSEAGAACKARGGKDQQRKLQECADKARERRKVAEVKMELLREQRDLARRQLESEKRKNQRASVQIAALKADLNVARTKGGVVPGVSRVLPTAPPAVAAPQAPPKRKAGAVRGLPGVCAVASALREPRASPGAPLLKAGEVCAVASALREPRASPGAPLLKAGEVCTVAAALHAPRGGPPASGPKAGGVCLAIASLFTAAPSVRVPRVTPVCEQVDWESMRLRETFRYDNNSMWA